jgi:hypothetical protein
MDRRAAVASLAPVHARALGLLDEGVNAIAVAAALGLDLPELTVLVRVAEAKVDRILREPPR